MPKENRNRKTPVSSWYLCGDMRKVLLGSGVVKCTLAFLVTVIGAASIGSCSKDNFGSWAMAYGAAMFSASMTTVASVHNFRRTFVVLSLYSGIAVSFTAMVIESVSMMCISGGDGATQQKGTCPSFLKHFGSCVWMVEHYSSEDSTYADSRTVGLLQLFILLLYLATCCGMLATMCTEAGRTSLCPFDDIIREVGKLNANTPCNKRTRRNKILDVYISKAKPEERSGIWSKVRYYLCLGGNRPTADTQRSRAHFA